jgi:hypothetical protein
MKTKSFSTEISIGATEELSLRVSVAALARVLFPHPDDGNLMLALERKATLFEEENKPLIDVKAQPFGGALRLHDLKSFQELIGELRFDSEESRAEQDFRIFIRPADWEVVREFCLGHLRQPDNSVLEADPARELAEEFADALGIDLKPDQYTYQAFGTVLEDQPSTAKNIYARGYPTVRIYRIFEVHILDSALASTMIENSEICSDEDLRQLALQDFRNGGAGRANGMLTMPFEEINDFYTTIPVESRNQPILFQTHHLDETVGAILEGAPVPKYRRL